MALVSGRCLGALSILPLLKTEEQEDEPAGCRPKVG